MRSILIAVALAASAVSAPAQVSEITPSCVPKTFWTPFGTGTDWVRGQVKPDPAAPATSFRAWWCPRGSGVWSAYIHLSVDRAEFKAFDVDAALDTAARSADKLAALQDIIDQFSFLPTAAERPSWDAGKAAAWVALAAIKPPPPAPIGTWVTPSAGTIFTYANGKLTGVTGRKSVKGATCDCASAKAVVGSTTYCAVAGAAKTEVTACVKQ